MDKRLTVIIPGYNTREEWWRRCVESVRRACGPEDEIICVDDGSKVPVRASWVGADVDARVRLVRKENGGLASARNAGMELMQGKYVTFVDSDDEVKPEAFARCIQALEEDKADIAIYGVRTVWVNNGLQKDDVLPIKYYGELSPQDVQALSRACLMNYACNKIYSVYFITGINSAWNKKFSFEPDGMPCEDIIFNLECVMGKAKWTMVDYVGYVYYRTGGTLLSCYKPSNSKGLQYCAQVWNRYCKTLAPEDAKLFADRCEIDGKSMLRAEWKNIWMPKTPYSLAGRWKWMIAHPEIGKVGWWFFLKTLAYSFCRRHFYIRPIRRWHIRRMYPQVKAVD